MHSFMLTHANASSAPTWPEERQDHYSLDNALPGHNKNLTNVNL